MVGCKGNPPYETAEEHGEQGGGVEDDFGHSASAPRVRSARKSCTDAVGVWDVSWRLRAWAPATTWPRCGG
jgi:hypothetical protein